MAPAPSVAWSICWFMRRLLTVVVFASGLVRDSVYFLGFQVLLPIRIENNKTNRRTGLIIREMTTWSFARNQCNLLDTTIGEPIAKSPRSGCNYGRAQVPATCPIRQAGQCQLSLFPRQRASFLEDDRLAFGPRRSLSDKMQYQELQVEHFPCTRRAQGYMVGNCGIAMTRTHDETDTPRFASMHNGAVTEKQECDHLSLRSLRLNVYIWAPPRVKGANFLNSSRSKHPPPLKQERREKVMVRSVQLALLVLAGLGAALPQETSNKVYKRTEGEIEYNVFEHAATGTALKYVKNSGICETTPGVNQYSGYQTTGDNQHMWWWFFEARNNSKTAPLALWLNGGPGCSSMLGLFQENGPCTFNNGGSQPKLNPYSWNTYANMLYVDEPIGAGFSYGDVNAVNSTPQAAPFIWNMVQAFLEQFPDYQSRDFGLFTESYGGHYGPEFAYYFEQQNAAIDAGKLTGEKINLVALGVNNAWIDAKNQYKSYVDFAVQNKYRPLLNASDAQQYYDTWTNKCSPAYVDCDDDPSSDKACALAANACYQYVESPLEALARFDAYDIRADDDSFPPSTFVDYITSPSVKKAIGATSNFSSCGDSAIGDADGARSFLPQLSSVIKSGIDVLIWAGDADWICNWMGNYDALQSIAPQEFVSAALQNYTVDGMQYGEFKTAGNLNWLRVYGAGHEVPAYQPKAALAAFTQIMSKQSLKST